MTYDEMVKNLGYATCTKTVSKPTTTKKEHKPMDFANAQIVVGNRVYPSKYVNYETSIGEYPSIEVEAILDPFHSVPYVRTPKPTYITNVIFNPPATIVFWSDNTKTVEEYCHQCLDFTPDVIPPTRVVKADYAYDNYDPEKGIAMAISKKMLGDNKYEYYNTFKHWLKKWNKQRKTDAFIEYLEKNITDDNE